MGAEAGKTIFISGGTGGAEEWLFRLQKQKGSQLLQMGMHRIKNAFYPLVQTDSSITKTGDYTQTVSDVDYVLDTLGGAAKQKTNVDYEKRWAFSIFKSDAKWCLYKEMNSTKWNNSYSIGGGLKIFIKMAQKYYVHYHFIFVRSNGAQLQGSLDILQTRN